MLMTWEILQTLEYSDTPLPDHSLTLNFISTCSKAGVRCRSVIFSSHSSFCSLSHLIIWNNTFQSGLLWVLGEQHPDTEIVIIQNKGSRKVRFSSFRAIKIIKKDFFIPTVTPYKELQKLGMDISAGSSTGLSIQFLAP